MIKRVKWTLILFLVLISQMKGVVADDLPNTPASPSSSVILMQKWVAALGKKGFSREVSRELQTTNLELKKAAILEYSNYLFKNYPEPNSDNREEHYNQFLKTADRLIPQAKICSYFYDCYSNNIINIDGLNVLFKHYNSRKNYAHKFTTSKALESEDLVAELNQMNQEKFLGEKSLLIRQGQKGTFGKHITPILIRKTASETQFIILDSLGNGPSSPYKWPSVTERLIRESKLPNIRVHKFSINRQLDGKTCPIFSFKDALQNTKTNLFDAIDSCHTNPLQIESDCNHPYSYTMHSILPQFMKLTQSLEIVETYLKKSPEYEATPVSTTGTLSDVIAQYKETPTTSNYARKHAYKYYSIVLGELLNSIKNP